MFLWCVGYALSGPHLPQEPQVLSPWAQLGRAKGSPGRVCRVQYDPVLDHRASVRGFVYAAKTTLA